ncbi:MAG: hypothetical protein KC586_13180 [Myxococcales bacterium]|nr:hypothetical protein [Myxococcales bacterium]
MNELWPRFAVPGGGYAALAIAVVLVALVVRELRTRPPRRLAMLRVLTALAAFLVTTQPRWTWERTETSRGRIAVLVDGSRSMQVRDRAGTARELLQRWSADAEGATLQRFGAELESASFSDLERATEPRADESALEAALEALAETDANGEIGAVVVVSDGASRYEGPEPDLDGRKVHAIVVGQAELRDDALAGLEADPVAFLRTPAEVRLTVRRLGAGGPLPVTLRQGDQVVAETSVDVPEGEAREVVLPFEPRRLGRAVYTVSIPHAAGDEVPQNDERSFLVRVERDRLRVLLVAGEPTWDVRFLRQFLKRDPAIDLISFFILRTASDLTMASPDELALIPFPTDELFREHLGSFDVLLFQNFDFGPYQMAGYLPRIRDYVRRGGSFAMVGGEKSFASGGYSGTPIADVLPVTLPPVGTPPSRLVVEGRFSPRVEPELVRHPLVALAPSPAASVTAWSRLAPLEGINRVVGAREGASVLLTHPTERLPVLVTGSADEGRVLALTTDTAWRWGPTTGGLRGDASTFERFWDRALRWLARDPSLEPAQLTTDRERYGPEARVRVSAVLRDARYQPLAAEAVRVEVRAEGAPADVAPFSEVGATTDAEGQVEVVVRGPLEPGAYRVVARRNTDVEPLASELFVVEAGGEELADPRADPERMERLALASGGSVSTAADAPDLRQLDASRTRRLGTHELAPFGTPWAFLGMVGLLALEWWQRRRAGAR